jgi:DNA-binding response OmpR family regulator
MAERLLLVDRDVALLGLWRWGFEQGGYQVRTATAAQEALAVAAAWRPDVIVLALLLSKMCGLAVYEALRQEAFLQTVPVLILTEQSDPFFRAAALRLGAADYLTKPLDFEVLQARVAACVGGQRAWDTATSTAALRLDPTKHAALVERCIIPLQPQEYQVLALLHAGPNRLVTRATFAHYLWPQGLAKQSNILDVYIRRLRIKLQGAGYRGWIRTIPRVGYLLVQPGEDNEAFAELRVGVAGAGRRTRARTPTGSGT